MYLVQSWADYYMMAMVYVDFNEDSNQHKLIRERWTHSSTTEFERLFKGVGNRIKSPINTCFFIHKHHVPADRFKDVTYGKFECSVKSQKVDEPYCTRPVLGSNWIHCDFNVGTQTADILLFKILLNSIVSTPGAKFMMINISDFYLNTPLMRWEYVKLNLRNILDETIREYNLKEREMNGSVYGKVREGMYGLPRVWLLSNELLQQRLALFGYQQSKLVRGLWKHDWRPIQFTLVVDDFGVKYVGEEHAEHLVASIQVASCRTILASRLIGIMPNVRSTYPW